MDSIPEALLFSVAADAILLNCRYMVGDVREGAKNMSNGGGGVFYGGGWFKKSKICSIHRLHKTNV